MAKTTMFLPIMPTVPAPDLPALVARRPPPPHQLQRAFRRAEGVSPLAFPRSGRGGREPRGFSPPAGLLSRMMEHLTELLALDFISL